MSRFVTIEFLPEISNENKLDTLRRFASLIDNYCEIGKGQEIDSFHYVEQTYFLWRHNDYSVKLYWSDEDHTKEYFWIFIECENCDVNDIANELLNKLRPFYRESKIKDLR